MKNTVKYILQKILGYEFYLYVFAVFKIKTLRRDKNENDFFYFLDSIPKNDGLILDIGANLGIMTYYLATRFPKNNIFSIEPMPSNFSVLSKIKQKFNLVNVNLCMLALGEDKQRAKMILPSNQGTKMQGLSHIKHPTMELWNEGEVVEVEMDTLDHLFPNKKIKAIKIDVENFEYFVLKGGIKLISTNKPVIYTELWDNENRVNCIDFLKTMDYKCFVIENGQITLFNSQIHKQHNFLFISQN